MHRPERTCVGCRGRGSKIDLIRLVSRDGTLRLDAQQIEPGRGAYVHPDPACVSLAIKRRALSRALRSPVESGTLLEVAAPALQRASGVR